MSLATVIPVRAGDNNDELKYTLRCLDKNFPAHGTVWIVGYKPGWLKNVEYIPGNNQGGHWNTNVYRNILAAAEHPDIPDEWLILNDDFFITQAVERIPVHYWGPLTKQCSGIRRQPKTWWHHSLLLTLEVLQDAGYTDPISYEVHCPLPVNKQGMADVLRKFADIERNGIPVQWRTVYGVVNQVGGTQIRDCKARHGGGPILTPFHSTSDASFRHYRRYFATRYPTPSRYEKSSG